MLTFVGKYRVIARIAEGSTGTVYQAQDSSLDRVVALKLLAPRLAQNTHARERFKAEARTAAQLKHPHIAQAFDVGEHEQALFIAFEFVSGPTLRDALQNRATAGITLESSVQIARQIASALDYAHEKGVLHGDVKPANIVLTTLHGAVHAVVVDFGLSWLATEAAQETQTGAIYGTPRYLAPEQIKRRGIDARSDVYSFACIVYELLSGASPFRDTSSDTLIQQHLYGDPDPIREHAPALPAGCDAIFARALAKSPDARYASASAFVDALMAALRMPAAQQSEQAAQTRSKLPFALAASACVLAIGGGIWSQLDSDIPILPVTSTRAPVTLARPTVAPQPQTSTESITPSATLKAIPGTPALDPNPFFMWGTGLTWQSNQNTFYGAFRPIGDRMPSWSIPIENSIGAIVANQIIVFVNDAGTIVAHDWESGDLRWRVEMGAPVALAPRFGGKNIPQVFVVDAQGVLHVYNIGTGELLWEKSADQLNGEVVGITIYGDALDKLVVTTRNGYLHELDETGLLQWTLTPQQLGVTQTNSPASIDNTMAVFNAGTQVVAVSLTERDVAWTEQLDTPARFAPIVVGDESVIIADTRDQVIVLNAKTGARRHRFTSDQPIAGVAADWGRVLVVGRDGAMTFWHQFDGRQLWTKTLDRNITGRPLIVSAIFDEKIVDTFVIVLTESGARYFSLENGDERVDDRIRSASPAIDLVIIPPNLIVLDGKQASQFKP